MKKAFILFCILISVANIMNAQTKIKLTVGGKSVSATLVDNGATRELVSLLQKGSITIDMNDYGGFEKVGALPQSLPTSNSQITTSAGDIMLYQGYNMVIFYGSNSWSYTRLGKIDDEYLSGLREFLGNGNITLTISLDTSSGIGEISTDNLQEETVYDLNGNRITHRPLSPGFYIINGRKVLIKN